MILTAAYRAKRFFRSPVGGTLIALLALIFTIAISIQVFPTEGVGHARTTMVTHSIDVTGSQSGPLGMKDNCGAPIPCHHAPADLPAAYIVGFGGAHEPTSWDDEHGAFRLVRLQVPPPKFL